MTPIEGRRKRPPVPSKSSTFTVQKDGASLEVTIDAEHSEKELFFGGLSIVTFDMLNKGGMMRILSSDKIGKLP